MNPSVTTTSGFDFRNNMAKYFNESDIDEFRDCFLLFAKGKNIMNPEELTIIMRSLGFSPTAVEIEKYFEQNAKEHRIDFATFLDIMHIHSQKEKCQQEIMAAFRAHDKHNNGTVPGVELANILNNFGEKLTAGEVDRLFKEAKANPRGPVRYEDILRVMLTPLPDY